MGEAIDLLTAERPLVLWLEDLHWGDVSTLELLALLARRRESAQLLLISTYRLEGSLANGHPLRGLTQDLQAHRQSITLPVPFLTEPAVAEYPTLRAASLQALVASSWASCRLLNCSAWAS